MNQEEREALVLEYVPEVQRKARQIARRMPRRPTWDVEDLESWGMVGLLRALDRYDETRGLALKTWGNFAIEHAMYDGIREMERGSRSVAGPAEFLGLDDVAPIRDRSAPDLDRKILEGEVTAGVDRLRTHSKRVLQLYYINEMRMPDVEKTLGITERDGYRQRNRALRELRTALAA